MNDQPEHQTAPSPPRRPAQSRRRRWTVGFWMILTNFILALLVVYFILSLTQSRLSLPQWLVTQIEDSANESLGTGRVSLGRLSVTVNNSGLPAVLAGNVGIFDDGGSEVARLNEATLRISPVRALRGNVVVRSMDVSGAQVVIRRRVDGTFALSFGSGAATTGNLPDLLDTLELRLSSGFLENVQDVTATDLTITLEDARSARIWQITDGGLRLDNLPDGLDISVNFDVFNGTEELAETEFSLRSSRSDSSAQLGAKFTNAAAQDIALQSPALSYLRLLDAPISGAMRTSFAPDGNVQSLDGTLEIGTGVVAPNGNAAPVPFENGRAYFRFDPENQKITFDELSFSGGELEVRGSAHAYLRDFRGQWPNSLVTQMQISKLRFDPSSDWSEAFEIKSGAIDMKLGLSPFRVDFGQVALATETEEFFGRGHISAGTTGWAGAMDIGLAAIETTRLLAMWPTNVLPGVRLWIAENVLAGRLERIRVSGRKADFGDLAYEASFGYSGAKINVMPNFPVLSKAAGYANLSANKMTMVVEQGEIAAPDDYGSVDVSGSSFVVPDVRVQPSQAEVSVELEGPLAAVLSLMALPPINALDGSGVTPEFASGQARANARLNYPMTPDRKPEEFRYSVTGVVENMQTTAIIPDKLIESRLMQVSANNAKTEIFGPFNVGAVQGKVNWLKENGPQGDGLSKASGTIDLSQSLVDEFSLGLPDAWVGGKGIAAFDVTLLRGQPPALSLQSDLRGATLNIPEISWSKPADRSGNLRVVASLGTPIAVPSISLSAPGLTLADGRITFRESGALDRASFGQVAAGNWLSAPVSFVGRGGELAPRIVVEGGTFDLRNSNFGSSAQGQGGTPIDVSLDRFIVSSSIAMTNVVADLDTSNGLAGDFSGRLNGGVEMNGQLEQVRDGVAVRLRSNNGGRVLNDAGILPGAIKGNFELTLTPQRGDVLYRGNMTIKNTEVREAPVLGELLSALSVVGLLDQMRGAGIVFSDVAATFDITGDVVRLLKSSAVGPSLGVSMDGVYDLNRSTMDMQGVISPVYFLNAIGQIFSAREGEGLFGFNFALKGPSDAPSVQVNPLSILTPGVFRDIFRAQPPGQ